MKRVLVTGASGFLGRQCLAPLSEAGYEVHAVHHARPVAGPAIWHQVDLLDPAATGALIERIRPSHLLHAAWYLEPGKTPSSLENFRWVAASLALLQVFHQAGGRRVVAIGSCFEYDWAEKWLTERETPLRPRTVYGECKRSLGELTGAFSTAAGLSAAWARVFFLFGPHEDERRLVASVIMSILAGQQARTTHGRQFRDYLSVTDAGQALAALLDSEVSGPVNIASGHSVQVKEIVEFVAAELGGKALLNLGAIPLSSDEPERLDADVSRLTGEVGWRPDVSLEDRLRETVAWYREQAAGSVA